MGFDFGVGVGVGNLFKYYSFYIVSGWSVTRLKFGFSVIHLYERLTHCINNVDHG